MKQVAQLLNAMVEGGVLSDYAVFGAVAQMRYTEAVTTGRAKDYARVVALLESGAANREHVERLCAEHGLTPAWKRFKTRFLHA